jgi:hypothetical protein
MEHYEKDFERRRDAPGSDVRNRATYAYTDFGLAYLSHDFEVLDRLQPHAQFCNTVMGALQAGAIARTCDKHIRRSSHRGSVDLR